MTDTIGMLRSHPSPAPHVEALAACIDACRLCLATCNACADACIGSSDPKEMARCIRTDLDCADVCAATVAVLCRQTETNSALIRSLVTAMKSACSACGKECMSHAKMMDHCKRCGEACQACEQACDSLLASLKAA